jgi:hypothetical protein
MKQIARPAPDEYASFYARYLDYLPREADVIDTLRAQLQTVPAAVAPAGATGASFRYADGKWSIREVIGHLTDAERIFTYRLLRVARGDQTPLPGFDENEYVAAADFEQRSFSDVIEEWTAVRRATLALADGISAAAWERRGTANDTPVSARAILYIIAGHTEHHLSVLRTRYGLR